MFFALLFSDLDRRVIKKGSYACQLELTWPETLQEGKIAAANFKIQRNSMDFQSMPVFGVLCEQTTLVEKFPHFHLKPNLHHIKIEIVGSDVEIQNYETNNNGFVCFNGLSSSTYSSHQMVYTKNCNECGITLDLNHHDVFSDCVCGQGY
jgi:hypothetical protein